MNSTEPMINIYIKWCHGILIPQNFEPRAWAKKKLCDIYSEPRFIYQFKISYDNANKLGFDILLQRLSDHDFKFLKIPNYWLKDLAELSRLFMIYSDLTVIHSL